MTLSEHQVDQLLERVDAGSDSAAHHLIREYRQKLRTMVAVRLDPRLQARVDPSDVVQDVLLRAASRLPEYARTRELPFYPWLRQMAWDRLVELHHQHVRAQKRTVTRECIDGFELSDQSVDALVCRLRSKSPSAEAVRTELRNRVQEAVGALDELGREVVLMHYVEQMKLREIAAVLKISESAVKSRHIRALEKLARVMGDVEDYR